MSGGGREFDPEGRTLARFRGKTYRSAHSFKAFFYNGKTNARSRVFRGLVQPLEQAEDSLVEFEGDANAVIPDVKVHCPASALGLNLNARSSSGCHETNSIAQ